MTRLSGRRAAGLLAATFVAAVLGSCTANGSPSPGGLKYPNFPRLDVPANLPAAADLKRDLELAWQRLQSGDAGAAKKQFADLLKRSPQFYPAEAGLGLAALAARDYPEATARFNAALARNSRYMPALVGAVDASIGRGDDEAAMRTLETIVKLDPARESDRSRLDVLRVRHVQAQIDAGRRAREGGRLDEAQASFEHALAAAPNNVIVLRELALVDVARGRFPSAETRIRQALKVDAEDAESLAVLGDVLQHENKPREAADAYARAVALDPRPGWRDKQTSLRQQADEAALPDEFRLIANAPRVTRADVAALIGTRLGDVVAAAPRKLPVVATDVPGHWAATWIVPVTQAGVMDVLPNHTFQPKAPVRRIDLAQVVATLLGLISTERGVDLGRWKAARPKFSDLASTHFAYATAAIALSSGAMNTDADRFAPDRVVTGAEATAAIGRLQQIAAK